MIEASIITIDPRTRGMTMTMAGGWVGGRQVRINPRDNAQINAKNRRVFPPTLPINHSLGSGPHSSLLWPTVAFVSLALVTPFRLPRPPRGRNMNMKIDVGRATFLGDFLARVTSQAGTSTHTAAAKCVRVRERLCVCARERLCVCVWAGEVMFVCACKRAVRLCLSVCVRSHSGKRRTIKQICNVSAVVVPLAPPGLPPSQFIDDYTLFCRLCVYVRLIC